MLTRAARPRPSHLRRELLAAHKQLHLPWLCPSLLRSVSTSKSRTSKVLTSQPPLRSPPFNASAEWSRVRTRRLNVAVDASPYSAGDGYIPFDSAGASATQAVSSTSSSHDFSPLLWTKRQIDPLPMSAFQTSVDNPQFVGAWGAGLHGTTSDKMTHLFASLQVGRMDRAATIVKDIFSCFQSDAPEVLEANEQYLIGELEIFLQSGNIEAFTRMQRWFELDMKTRRIPLSARACAAMLKAAFQIPEQGRRERTLRRYLMEAQNSDIPDVEEDALASPIFIAEEFDWLIRSNPAKFDPSEMAKDISLTPEPHTAEVADSATNALSLIPGRYAPGVSPVFLDIPELLAATQKGSGLEALKRSMQSLNKVQASDEDPKDINYARQEKLERDAVESALERWRHDNSMTKEARARGKLTQGPLGSHVYEWVQEMKLLIAEEINESEQIEDRKALRSGTQSKLPQSYFRMAPPETIAVSTIIGFMDAVITNDMKKGSDGDSYGIVPVSKMLMNIGRAVSREMQNHASRTKMLQLISELPTDAREAELAKAIRQQRLPNGKPPPRKRSLKYPIGEKLTDEFSNQICMEIGGAMLALLLKVAKLPATREQGRSTASTETEYEPIGTHEYRWNKGKKVGVIRATGSLKNFLKAEPSSSFIAKHLPMLIPPRPWTGVTQGAYLRSKVPAVRLKDFSNVQRSYLSVAEARGDLKYVFAGLDVIGSVPWRVNGEVFQVMTEVWNSGERIAGFAPAVPKLTLPPEPSKEDRVAHLRWKRIVQDLTNENTGLHSQRCYQNFQLEVAKTYLNDTFYCPHSIDFRGRAYPIPPYFNHMGADHVRGLFLFAEGKPLGQDGLRWLKIHLANVYGYDKESLNDREAFAGEHLDDIYDSVKNPLTGRRWWLNSEDPWQCLAACVELVNALDSPVPSEFVSRLPIQQDGSCNGLQHYAALGGDEIGAQQVNLAPGDRPADIYSGVAALVRKTIESDAAAGSEDAIILQGNITRRVVKQTVMTNVYGVTFHGAMLQVRKQLSDILPKPTLENKIDLSKLSSYVAHLIFRALNEMFNGAVAIQNWLGECGTRVSSSLTPEQIERIRKSRSGELASPDHAKRYKKRLTPSTLRQLADEDYQFKSTLVWTTPLGLPVAQPYRKSKPYVVKTSLQDVRLDISSTSDPVSKRRQLQAFAPNFIHSLDASHMMLSAIKCNEIGMTFASVHDSFWTHACDVPIMNRVLRDAFIQMHSEDIIGRLREEFEARYSGCMQLFSIPLNSETGQRIWAYFDAKKIKKATVCKANIKHNDQVEELLLERERQTLLASDKPEDQAAGRRMTTAASIFEESGSFAESMTHSRGPMSQNKILLSEMVQDEDSKSVPKSDTSVQPFDEADQDDLAASTVYDNKSPQTQGPDEEIEPSTSKSSKAVKIHFWAPLTFPPTPAKGTFQVSQLKESQYFFS